MRRSIPFKILPDAFLLNGPSCRRPDPHNGALAAWIDKREVTMVAEERRALAVAIGFFVTLIATYLSRFWLVDQRVGFAIRWWL